MPLLGPEPVESSGWIWRFDFILFWVKLGPFSSPVQVLTKMLFLFMVPVHGSRTSIRGIHAAFFVFLFLGLSYYLLMYN